MVDIQQSYIVPVGMDRSVVVYGDSDKTDRFYIVPEPVICRDATTGLPEFSLVRYEASERDVAGVCRFFVELQTSDDVKGRVIDFLRARGIERPELGQFDWLQLDPYLSYDVMGKAKLVQGTPSMQGTNRTAFLVQLGSAAEVDSFVAAFTGGALSPFSVEFDVTSLTKLPAVKATITYDAKIAISYETRYDKQKDIWGQEKQIAAEVKQQLRESNAGDVKLNWGTHQPSDETRQRVLDWAWTTLENLVTAALAEAQSRSVGNSPVDYTGSFGRTYSENQVVEWTFSTSRPLPAYDEATWRQLYRVVRERQLTVNFNLTGVLKDVVSNKQIVDSVQVVVEYPTRLTGNSFVLRPDRGAGYVYEAPGHFVNGVFDPRYRYKYTVSFADGKTYESVPVESTVTIVDILPSDVGIRQVTFIGSQIPFAGVDGGEVAQLLIDFFFQQPAGRPNKIDTKVMTANGPDEGSAVLFNSYFPQRITDVYSYRLTYVMRDSKQYVVAPRQAFGSRNADRVMLVNPFSESQEFMLTAFIPEGATRRIARISLGCSYRDEPNQTDRRHTWDWRLNQAESGFQFAEPWQFVAFPNQTAARFVMDGTVYFSDGKRLAVNNLVYPAVVRELSVDPGIEPYSVRIDSSVIDWETVTQVDVTLFQYQGEPGPAAAVRLLRRDDGDDRRRHNYLSYALQRPSRTPGETQRFYPVTRTSTEMSVVFYWAATYLHADGSVAYAGNVDVTDRFVVDLPPDGTSPEPVVQVRELPFGDPVAARR